MNKKRLIFSLSFNVAIVVLTIIGLGIGVIDSKTMNMPYVSLLKYFTTLSNLFLCIAATIMLIYQILTLSRKVEIVPRWTNIVKLSAVVSTTITMFVVLFFLLPMSLAKKSLQQLPPSFLFTNSNLIFHLLNPLLGIIGFILFDNEQKDIKFPQTLFSLIFVGCYEIFYTLDVYLHFIPSEPHDWYNFTVFGDQFIPLILIAFLAVTFLISWLLWLINKKIHLFTKSKKQNKNAKK